MEDQIAMNEAITKVVAEATRVAMQTFSEVQSHRSEGQPGSKLGSQALKQPQFNWKATDKYTEWKAFILQVKIFFPCIMPKSKIKCHDKELFRQEGSTLFRKPNRGRKTHMQHSTGTVQYISSKIQTSVQ